MTIMSYKSLGESLVSAAVTYCTKMLGAPWHQPEPQAVFVPTRDQAELLALRILAPETALDQLRFTMANDHLLEVPEDLHRLFQVGEPLLERFADELPVLHGRPITGLPPGAEYGHIRIPAQLRNPGDPPAALAHAVAARLGHGPRPNPAFHPARGPAVVSCTLAGMHGSCHSMGSLHFNSWAPCRQAKCDCHVRPALQLSQRLQGIGYAAANCHLHGVVWEYKTFADTRSHADPCRPCCSPLCSTALHMHATALRTRHNCRALRRRLACSLVYTATLVAAMHIAMVLGGHMCDELHAAGELLPVTAEDTSSPNVQLTAAVLHHLPPAERNIALEALAMLHPVVEDTALATARAHCRCAAPPVSGACFCRAGLRVHAPVNCICAASTAGACTGSTHAGSGASASTALCQTWGPSMRRSRCLQRFWMNLSRGSRVETHDAELNDHLITMQVPGTA
jgi:hypothetical protein